MQEKKVFAKGVGFQKLFVFFIIGCVFGTYYEMILNLIRHYIHYKDIFWETRQGVIYGPFSPVYGLGAVIITWVLAEKNHKWWQTLIYGALLGGVVEYVASLLQEWFTGTSSWNYSAMSLHINGRTTIPIMLVWGIFCVFFIKILYPFISKLVEKLPYKQATIVLNICVILLSLDMFISFSAVIRQSLRRDNIPAYTFYGEFLDKYYTDERLSKAYRNMWVVKKKWLTSL